MGAKSRLPRLLLPFLLIPLVAGCGPSVVRAPVEARQLPADAGAHPGHHTVSKGDTLYSIAWIHDLDYRDVARWNGIPRPYRIYPGQRLRLDPPAVSPPRPPPPKRVPADPPARAPQTRPESRPVPPPQPATRPARQAGAKLVWAWPAAGTLQARFDDNGSKGIDIAGTPGAPIQAASTGKVVYSGSGLRGYGKLIIIKHNNTHLSAYAHNEKLLVEEGERVDGGQRIATMGQSGSDRVKLHFQIRRNGKPVDPLLYLPGNQPPAEKADA